MAGGTPDIPAFGATRAPGWARGWTGAGPCGRSAWSPRTRCRPRATVSPGMDVGLGWHIDSSSGHAVVWHNGGTFGSSAFIAYDTVAGTGVVVLSNTGQSIDDVGFRLLYGQR